jgi:hypothetical protein
MKRRTLRASWLLYILLNIIVSAATTLTVIVLWDRQQRRELGPLPTFEPQAAVPAATLPPIETPAETQSASAAAPTPVGEPLIEIGAVIGATDPQLEYVLLRRLGEGDLNLAGWTLSDSQGNVFRFPDQPALVLFSGGGVQVYTRVGADTPTEMYWNRADPVWEPGETVVLSDAQGNQQARYIVP